MKCFFATGAFILLIIQSVMLLESMPDLGSPDRTTAASALIVILINCLGIFFNVMTLRGAVCGRLD